MESQNAKMPKQQQLFGGGNLSFLSYKYYLHQRTASTNVCTKYLYCVHRYTENTQQPRAARRLVSEIANRQPGTPNATNRDNAGGHKLLAHLKQFSHLFSFQPPTARTLRRRARSSTSLRDLINVGGRITRPYRRELEREKREICL